MNVRFQIRFEMGDVVERSEGRRRVRFKNERETCLRRWKFQFELEGRGCSSSSSVIEDRTAEQGREAEDRTWWRWWYFRRRAFNM